MVGFAGTEGKRQAQKGGRVPRGLWKGKRKRKGGKKRKRGGRRRKERDGGGGKER